jgi:hypothetical protein
MANGRLFLRCQKCLSTKQLLKYYPSGSFIPDGDGVEDWVDEHIMDCYGYPGTLSDQTDGPLFTLQGE